MSVEILIYAHQCFSVAANMEGISCVLKNSLTLTDSLVKHSQWSVMVRNIFIFVHYFRSITSTSLQIC